MTINEAIDRAVLDELLDSLGGDREFLAELLDTFYDDTPQQLETIRQGLSSGDAEVVRRAAHSIKSNSATFGAMHLHGLCKALEDKGKVGDLEGAAELTAAIEEEYQRVKSELQEASGE